MKKKTETAAWHILSALALPMVLLIAGCAQQVGEIDRTQANIIEKKDLEGEWYFRMTTVEAPYASFFSFVGDQSKLERGVFEIQEKHLYFYRTYEFSAGSQTIGMKSDVDTPYLAWAAGEDSEYTPNPYQARDRKYAEGTPLPGPEGKVVPCGGKRGANKGEGMHEFCQEQTGYGNAYCGHEPKTPASKRTAANAVCVRPTRFVFRGAPLAVFPIESHFDIRKEYNPNTGEPTNVWVENSSDLYWYERPFMRVDWSQSQIPNFEFSLTSIVNSQKEQFLFSDETLQINDMLVYGNTFEGEAGAEGENLRIFRDESGAVEYFDYVTKQVVSAPTMYYEYFGSDIPICLFYPFYIGGVFECTSEEIKIRTAFMKVDPNDDYVPWNYDDHLFDKFGFFRQERHVFDKNYGDTYSGAIRNIARWDIWDSHPLKEDGTLDYEKMNPKPIVYYLSEGFPRKLVPMANELARQWSEPLNEVVAFYKGADAVPKSGMFVVCENNNDDVEAALAKGLPVAQYDPALCADMNYVKLNGDLRYSFLYAVNEPAEVGLLGYGPSAEDPLTGKIISASAYIYMGNLEQSVNRAADVVQEITGFIDYAATAAGLDIWFKNYPEKLAIGYNPPPASTEEAVELARNMISDDVKTRLTVMGLEKTDKDFTSMRMNMLKANPELEQALIFDDFRYLFRDIGALVSQKFSPGFAEKLALRNWANYKGVNQRLGLWMEYAKRNMYRVEFADGAILGLAKEWKDRYESEICSAVYDAVESGEELAFDLDSFNIVKEPCEAKMEGQKRPPEEAPKLRTWEEYDPSKPAEGDTCLYIDQKGFEPGYYWVNTCSLPKLAAQVSHKLQFTEMRDQLEYWRPSAWYAETKDPLVAKTQKFMRELGKKLRTEMVDEFRSQMFLSVALHEVGHTLGLRHNFEGSSDAMNFHPRYWEYKVSPSADGKSWLPVDLWSRETNYQVNNRMREFQYSSIMDYGPKFNDHWHGIGLYDKAAIRFGYGGLVDVFKKAPNLDKYLPYLANPEENGMPSLVPPEKVQSDQLEELFKRVHYTQIPNVFGSPQAIYERETVKFSDVVGKPCKTDADCTAEDNCKGCTQCRRQLGSAYCSPPDKVEVPYRFCSDEMVGATPTCDVWDSGADPYEIVRNTADDYYWYWLFWGHWRGKVTYSVDGYAYRILWAFSRMKRQFQWWALNYARFNKNNWWKQRFGVPWDQDLNGGLTGSMATAEAFNTLINVFAIPEGHGVFGWPSQYGFNVKNQRYETWTPYNDEYLTNRFILEEDYGKFGARPMYAGIAIVGEEVRFTTGGGLYDRLAALMTLTDPHTDFLNIDEVPDARKYLISFYTVFPERMISLLGGLSTHREANYAPCVVEDENHFPKFLKLRTVRDMNDPDFCKDGHYLEPERVDYDFPTTWFRLPMLATYYGMALMVNNYDRRFMDTTRIFLKGHEDAIDIPPGTPKVEFEDPMSGKTYVAYKMGEGDLFDTAWYLVNKAKEIFEKYQSLEELQKDYVSNTGPLQRMVSLLELIRGMHKVYDYALLVL